MKETIIIITILIIIFSGSIITQNYLNKSSDLLIADLDYIKGSIENKDINNEEVIKKTEEMYKKWEETNTKWSVIILHDEIDLIETSLIKMKAEIRTGEIEDAIAEIETAIFLLNHIKEKEKTNLKNIF